MISPLCLSEFPESLPFCSARGFVPNILKPLSALALKATTGVNYDLVQRAVVGLWSAAARIQQVCRISIHNSDFFYSKRPSVSWLGNNTACPITTTVNFRIISGKCFTWHIQVLTSIQCAAECFFFLYTFWNTETTTPTNYDPICLT